MSTCPFFIVGHPDSPFVTLFRYDYVTWLRTHNLHRFSRCSTLQHFVANQASLNDFIRANLALSCGHMLRFARGVLRTYVWHVNNAHEIIPWRHLRYFSASLNFPSSMHCDHQPTVQRNSKLFICSHKWTPKIQKEINRKISQDLEREINFLAVQYFYSKYKTFRSTYRYIYFS